MNLFAHSISSKGGFAFARRIGTIAQRFDLSSSRVEGYLDEYLSTLGQYGASATFPITAVVLRRHGDAIRRLVDAGVEFAVHGYIHTDHGLLSFGEQRQQFKRALDVFASEKVPVSGFRGPYLRYNEATVAVVEELGFDYISNETFSYDVIDPDILTPAWRDGYARAMRLYAARPAASSVVRPRMKGALVEIPVCMPDDEILVDRLGFNSAAVLGDTWVRLLDLVYARGDILTLQLHPERGVICREALAQVLRSARKRSPSVWIAQLRDVAAWWKRRLHFQLRVDPEGLDLWRITCDADPDATVWVKNLNADNVTAWYDSYATLDGTTAVVQCPRRPTIGVSPASEDARRFLADEGFAVDVVDDPGNCAYYVDRPGPLTVSDQAVMLAEIHDSRAPLVGIGRWPNRARAAMSITGDMDALTLLDFAFRVWEVR